MYRCRIEGTDTYETWMDVESAAQAAENHVSAYGCRARLYVVVDVMIIVGMESYVSKYGVDITTTYKAAEIGADDV